MGKAALGATEKGISVDANAGKAEAEGDNSVAQNAATAVSGQVNTSSEETQSFEAPVQSVINESGFKWWELALIVMLAGWAIPSPGEMLRGLVDIVRPRSRRRRI